ncbi:hypothetical protein R3W88_027035 [Solanum pinnatisectum]|uniref:C2H2-type domain-containing protein n=1 Tax=Solanum pinnatisectum TaxID=50273 RepID=A0AAV9LEW0_9SOLN|nr:hypothetical protein R3W88_027035 [Solanum pinnatisectum]
MCEGHRLKNQAEAFDEMISEVPFWYRAGESKISILNRRPEVEISQEQPLDFSGILLVKPNTIFSGAKRKAITLIEEVADKPSLSSVLVKNVTEWNCEICQVFTTSQDCLNDHLQRKKHKCKEATFREQKNDNKNWSIGFFPKKSKVIQLVECPCDDMISGKKSEEGSSSPNNNYLPFLLIFNNANDMRNNADHENQNISGFTFWCDGGTYDWKKTQTERGEQNYSIGLSSMKPQFIQLVEHPSNDMILGKKLEEGSSSTNDNDQP